MSGGTMGLGPRRSLAALAAALAVSCGQPESPTGPSGFRITGLWTGTATDSSGTGRVEWDLVQDGEVVTGEVKTYRDTGALLARGSVAGTLEGPTLRFALDFPRGSFVPPLEACSARASGSVVVERERMDGSYSGSNTCTGPFSEGRLVLTR